MQATCAVPLSQSMYGEHRYAFVAASAAAVHRGTQRAHTGPEAPQARHPGDPRESFWADLSTGTPLAGTY